ncbi:hypothetical protein Bca4012_009355 [Brassica carinata]
MNLQDVFQRFTFDLSMVLIAGSDPTSLSIEMPENEFAKALTAAGEGTMLYPPVPFERKSPVKADVLPSGHKVDVKSNIIIFLYALGRMKAVWGEDASEFKPERWVSNTGSLRHEPTFKFLVYNTGPRSCLGKQLTMNLMKTVIVEILQNYDIHLMEGQKINPLLGIVLRMMIDEART